MGVALCWLLLSTTAVCSDVDNVYLDTPFRQGMHRSLSRSNFKLFPAREVAQT